MSSNRFSMIDMIILPLLMAILSTIFSIVMLERGELLIAFFISFYSFNMYFVAISGLITKLTLRKKSKSDDLHNG
jgi:uncharacterized membrane protein